MKKPPRFEGKLTTRFGTRWLTVGPFYDTTRVLTLLDVSKQAVSDSKQAVSDRRKHGSVLAMRTRDGLWVYPVFLFEGRRVRPELTGVFRVFRGHDGWTACVWLTTRNDELEGRSPVEWLVHGLIFLPLPAPATWRPRRKQRFASSPTRSTSRTGGFQRR